MPQRTFDAIACLYTAENLVFSQDQKYFPSAAAGYSQSTVQIGKRLEMAFGIHGAGLMNMSNASQ